MNLQITMEEPALPVEHYLQFRVRRGRDSLAYGDWTHVHQTEQGREGLHASQGTQPVVEAWEEARDHALVHDIAWVYVEDQECLLDAGKLGLTRGPGNECAGGEEQFANATGSTC